MKRILVGLSGTPYTQSAIEHAIGSAKLYHASITGVTLLDLKRLEDVGPVPIGGGAAAHALAEHRLEITRAHIHEVIEKFEVACKNAGIDYEVDQERGKPLEMLMSLWRYHDLTVLGVRGLFEYGVIHHADDEIIKLLAHGVSPILAVAESYRKIERVLIAYNGSMESAKAMKRFVGLGVAPHIRVKLVTFSHKPDDAGQLLHDAADYCRAYEIFPEVEVIDQNPAEGVLQAVHAWEADLIVMGCTGRGRLAKFILGDAALYAMQHAEIPVFLAE